MIEYQNHVDRLVPGPIQNVLERLPPGELKQEIADLFYKLLQERQPSPANHVHTQANSGQPLQLSFRPDAQNADEISMRAFKGLETHPPLIWTADARGNHDYYNSHWLEYTGTSAQTGHKDGWLQSIHADDRQLCAQKWARSVIDGTNFELELRLKKAGGEYRWHLMRAIAAHDSSGKVERWCGFYTDIEVQKKLMSELINARDQAQVASKLKSEFVANMTHELRTPMNGVLGMVEVLLRSDLTPKAREYALMIQEAGKSLLAVINDILDFSKIEAGKLEIACCDFDLVSLVESVGDILAPQAESKNLELVTYIDPAIPQKMLGDPLRLRQVLLNLGSNAVKFTESGSICIRAEKTDDETNCVRVKFSISDSGIGIAPEHLDSLFEPFSQADGSISRKYGGTGLGLSISKRLVGLMGSTMTVDRAPGGGSIFSFSVLFPAQPLYQKVLDDNGVVPGTTILLIGVKKFTAECIKNYAHTYGVSVNAVNSVESVDGYLGFLQKIRNKPDAIIVEGLNVEEKVKLFSQKIRSLSGLQDTRIVYLTSHEVRANLENKLNKTGEACLARPVHRGDLINILKVRNFQVSSCTQTREVEALPSLAVRPLSKTCKTLKVLVADDNKMNQQVAKLLLGDMNLTVTLVDNGVEAVSAFNANRFDLVFLDCQMPEIDGYEACQIIRQIQQRRGIKVPIIAMTANAMRGSREKCLAAGMDDYISKPIDANILARVVQYWLEAGKSNKTSPALTAVANSIVEDKTAGEINFDLLQSRFNKQFCSQLLTMFVESVADEILRVDRCLEARAFGNLQEQLHAFRGSCGTICATGLVQTCKDIEAAAAIKDLQKCQGLSKLLKSKVAAALAEIDSRSALSPR